MTKKITALCLSLLLLLLALASCGADDNGAPEGMKSATLAGEPFLLYVPEAWSLNTASGISGAFYNSNQTILVSARYQKSSESDLVSYMNACMESYAQNKDWSELGNITYSDTILGGKDARRVSFTVKNGSENLTCFQVSVAHEGGFVSVHGYCATDLYEARKSDYDSILKEFVLAAPSSPQGEAVIDKNTPEGYQIASADQVEYRLYVPTTWLCDAKSGASEAETADKSAHVSLTSYSPDFSTDIKNYFTVCEETYKTSLPEYTLIERDIPAPTADGKVAGRTAYSYIYNVTVDGETLTIMQTLFVYNDMMYSFTYTAKADCFETYRADVNTMLGYFTFR